jgi:hypothetical protein
MVSLAVIGIFIYTVCMCVGCWRGGAPETLVVHPPSSPSPLPLPLPPPVGNKISKTDCTKRVHKLLSLE